MAAPAPGMPSQAVPLAPQQPQAEAPSLHQFHNAANVGDLDLVVAAVSTGHISVNDVGLYGQTALHRAAHEGHHQVCDYLLCNGANTAIADDTGSFPCI